MEVREPHARYLASVQRTELGELPADWEVVRLSDIATVTSGKRLPLGESLTTSETPHPYIRVSDMERGTVNSTAIQFVPVDVFPKIQQYRVFSTDLYISVAGTLGLVGQIPTALDGANLTENANRIAGIRGSKAYLYQVLASPLVQTVIESERTVGAQPKLALGRIRNFSIPLPPTSEEQAAIGRALTDADALIDSLEQLLTKKRQIKQGAMQELLTGERRLPGFEQPWISRTFADVAFASRERVNPSALNASPLCVELEHLESSTGRLSGDAFESKQAATKSVFRRGDVLFGKLRAYLRKYWLAEFDGVCSTEIWVLRPQGELGSSAYLFYTIQCDDFVEAASTAYGTHMPRSDWKIVSEFELALPSDATEQAAIAQVLSDMDAEIAALESRLTKARALKQAMAQALLTGRIRLMEPAA